jgi:hypothetical protein
MDTVVSTFKRSSFCKFVLGGGQPFPPMPVDVVKHLYKKFHAEVEALEGMLQRDLSAWKFPDAALVAELPCRVATPSRRR